MLNRYFLSNDVHNFFRSVDDIFRDAFDSFEFAALEAGNRKALPASTSALTRVPFRGVDWPVPAEAWRGGFHPAVESFTRDGGLVLQAELPGVDPANVEVSVDGDRLVIRGEKKDHQEIDDAKVHVRETRRGRFERSFTMPEGVKVGEIKASLDNGVLEVTIPIEAPEPARKINVEMVTGGRKSKK